MALVAACDISSMRLSALASVAGCGRWSAVARPSRHGGPCRASSHDARRASLLWRDDRMLRSLRRGNCAWTPRRPGGNDAPRRLARHLVRIANDRGPPHCERARQGDTTCLALLREEAAYVGAGFVSLIHLFNPERIIMGGGVSEAFDLLIDDIHAVIRRDAVEPFKDVPPNRQKRPALRAQVREMSKLGRFVQTAWRSGGDSNF
jgi:ROK family